MIEYIDKLEEISCQILLNCSGINSEYMEGWKRIQIYEHMGHTLLCLLKLLLHCQVDNQRLFKIIDDLINSICSLVNAITVDVFCAWAEVISFELKRCVCKFVYFCNNFSLSTITKCYNH